MNAYSASLQPAPVSASALRQLCEQLAPDPTAPSTAPAPTAGLEDLDPAKILAALKTATSGLVLEDGLLESTAAAVSQGHVIFTGPPGTAKSTLAMLTAQAVKGDAWVPATATAEWTVHDVVGGYMPGKDSPIVFEPGLVLDAFERGQWVVVDELNRADIDKAFGELFTILSSFPVTLPQRDFDTGDRVTVAPAGGSATYNVPKDWRLLGTMNTWDKTSLFRLSYAFMRRFAFIEVAVPPQDAYEELIGNFMAEEEVTLSEPIVLSLYTLFAGQSLRDVQRELGPAVAKAVIAHIAASLQVGASEKTALVAALKARVLPQFEGAFEEHDAIAAILRAAVSDTAGVTATAADSLIRSLASWTGAIDTTGG